MLFHQQLIWLYFCTHKRRVRTTLPRPSEANFSSKYHQDCAPSFCHRPFNVLPPTENRHVKDDAPYRRSGQSVCPVCATKHSIAGLIAPYSKPDSKYSLYTQATISACTTTIQRALLACRGARNGSSRPCRRAHRRNRRPWNLVISMRFFAHELATSQASQGMSGARI